MALTVKHQFVSALADDPAALAAGEICPQSHWNATHQLTGTFGAADAAFFNSGTGASASTFWRGDMTWAQATIGSGTSGQVAFWNGSTSLTGDSRFTFVSGQATLSGNSPALTISGTTGNGPGIFGGLSADSFSRLQFGLDGSNNPILGFGPGSSTRDSFINRQGTNSLGIGSSGTATDGTLNLATVNAALGTITANKTALNITATWNNSGVNFDAPLFMNVTNTASGGISGTPPGSLLADLQVGGATQFGVTTNGVLIGNSGNLGGVQIAGGSFTVGQFNNGWTNGASNAFATIGNTNNIFGLLLRNDSVVAWATNNVTNNTDATLSRYAASTIGLSKQGGAGATAFQVYNTVDVQSGTPTNFERGVFDWTTTANVLTIGMQKGGTGSARSVELITFDVANGSGNVGIHIDATTELVTPFDGAGLANAQWAFAPHVGLVGASASIITWTNGSITGGNKDLTLSRAAVSVLQIGTNAANANGWYQWAGQARVTADVTNSTVTLATATGLSVALQAGRTYSFMAELSWTDAAAGGIQLAMVATGGLTATNIIYDGYIIDSAANGIKGNTQATALGGVVASAVTTGTAGHARISGTITVNVAGTINLQFAQNTSNATATTIKRGSYMIVQDMP